MTDLVPQPKPIAGISRNDSEQCCSNTPVYEIRYNHISKTWLVCFTCYEIEAFNSGIKEKVRIQHA